MKRSNKVSAIAAVLTLTASIWGCAAPLQTQESSESEKRERRGPPKEAFEACAGLSESASCSVVTPRGEKAGTCVVAPNNTDELLCAPDGMKTPLQ